MAAVMRMPSVLAGAAEAALARWLVAPGDTVAVGTPVAEIETEKALVEYAAEEAGVIGRLVLGEGGSAEVGEPIAVLVSAGETDADIDAALGIAVPPSAARADTAGLAAAAGTSRGDRAGTSPGGPAGPVVNGRRAAPGGRVFASPLVRKLASERDIDLAALAGTGPNGRITRRDLERFLAAGPTGTARTAATASPPTSATTAGPSVGGDAEHALVLEEAVASPGPAAGGVTTPAGGTLTPHTPMRRAIARRLAESKASVPHFYVAAEPVVDELLAVRKRVNETSPVKVSVNDLVIAAVAAAFTDVPEANVTWSDVGLVNSRSVDIAIAVATDGGLVTPVLRGVERMKVSAIARQASDLAQRARDRRLLQHELEGGTFTVSNLGMYGTPEFSAIINPPQSGILAVGAARQQPVVADGALAVATVMRCTLSVDHRAIDGALAARWLAAFTARMENPLGALA
jgi:pyruvate dehydrogenase E2 component (dihydrolipoamide acetyltransferase)